MKKMQIKGTCQIFAMLWVLAATSPTVAEIYKWTDAEGNTHFSDKQMAKPNAAPVQLKSPINRYPSGSAPKFEYSPGHNKKIHAKGSQLPKLRKGGVILYSTVWCGFCKKAKAYFKQKGIAFSERDIEKSKQANKEYRALGGGGVPLILVGNKKGTQKLSGFSIARFDAAYH